MKGKFAEAFEAALAELAKDARYAELDWLKEPVEQLHNGYFAQDKKGVLKDTRGDTQADDEVYNLIMKDKERLLSLDEPLRFIFSHSALREGWDNPNVFQICTLNETQQRDEEAAGDRPRPAPAVDQNGVRVFDESVNKLYVMANESYEDFARALQTEYEEDCGVTFGKVPLTALAKLTRVVDGEEQPIGREAAEAIRAALVEQKMLDADGRIQPAFDPKQPGLQARRCPRRIGTWRRPSIDLLASYQIERHIRRERDEGAEPAEEGGHAQPGVPGTLGPDQAQDDLPRRVRDRRAGAPRRRRDQADGEDRGAEDPRQRRAGRRRARAASTTTAMSVAEEQVELRRSRPCPTCSPTCRTRPS